MSELPEGWVTATLSAVCQPPQYGWTASASRGGSHFKLLRTTDLRDGSVDWASVPFASSVPDAPERYLIRNGDVFISRAGSVGRSALIENPPERVLFGSYLIRMRPLVDELAPFLKYFLLSPGYWDQVRGHSIGIAIPNINASKLSSIRLPIPPLAEQRRIVAEIEKQFTRLKVANSMLCRAEQKAGVLLRQTATPCRLDTSNSRGLPLLPAGWCWKTAEEVCQFITKGTTPAKQHLLKQGDVPYIKVNNLAFTGELKFEGNSTFVPIEVHENELARSEVLPGDVLMNIVGPPLGKVSRVPSTYPRWNMNQAVARFRPEAGVLPEFLTVVLRSMFTLQWLLRMTKATVGQVNLTLETCRAIPIPVPPLSDQKEVAGKVAALTSEIEAHQEVLRQASAHAARLRQAILAKAISGRLVPQDPNDEPASVLLERIRDERSAHKPKAVMKRRRSAQLELTPQT